MSPEKIRRRVVRRTVVLACVGAGIISALNASVLTRQGVNFTVSAKRVPFYIKAVDFLHRHYQYRLLAEEITRGLKTDEERVMAVYHWTRHHIRPTPPGWPISDDHILHIIIRGHGLDDQMADVFCTLATYAGVPAFWRNLKPVDDGPTLTVSFAKVDGAWRVFDVVNGLAFADAQGRLVDVVTLVRDPALAEAIAGPLRPSGLPYSQYLALLQPFTVPDVLRAQQQMPWPRLWFEMRRVLHQGLRANAATISSGVG